jgi:putative membrane protein
VVPTGSGRATTVSPMSTRTRAAHVIRGGLIGAAEAVPGISGGTVALVVGVYESLIHSAGHLISGLKALLTDRARAREEFRQVSWGVVLPVLLGMAPALVIALRVLGPALERYPVQMRGLFLGMVAASLVVPIAMVGSRWRLKDYLVAIAGAVVAFAVTGLPQLGESQSKPVVFVAAAVAICALVMPGVSGSFILLTFGVYEPTAQAVRDLDLAYIAVFGLGAVVGLALFVKGLQWLLEHHRRVTMVAATGLIAGALRGVWPWQTEDRGLLAPEGHVLVTVLLFLAGGATVLGIFLVEQRRKRRTPPEPELLSRQADSTIYRSGSSGALSAD